MRTLIVDHEPHVLRSLCEAEQTIEEVTVAECGAKAIEEIRASRPDLMLLDVELQDMSGFDLLRSLKPAARPAVIMVAAHEVHAPEAFRSGAVDYLTKPVGADRFTAAIEKVHRHAKGPLTAPQGSNTKNKW